ncbi:uncharacterized protein C11orf16-like isoform X2 [Sceloporus undulatus]|uniref:uncharacterized protein C11orf16-like isoform X2 n=1 Tax=Sceloporus undulatus TaxID=8520 RepID=UPI001C4B685F|nr:uncharacterized protein C11orf16-like isoform X2 [Sceloporus undulatus]
MTPSYCSLHRKKVSEMSHHCHGAIPVADIHKQNVAFVICASESNPSKLCILKEVLIKTLFSLPNKLLDSMFNVISFSGKVLKWQNRLVACSLTTVTEAATWVRALQISSTANILNAVAAALEDPTCQAVYLFTSEVPEGTVEELCRLFKDTEQAHPVHTVYVLEGGEERKDSSQKILEKVAKESGGSFQSLSPNGASDEDNPGCTAGIHCSVCISKQHSTLWLTGHCKTQFPLGTWSPDFPDVFLGSSMQEDSKNWSSEIHNLPRGIRVLARKQIDGYYYPGHIVQMGSREQVLIKFERPQRPRKGRAQSQMQETPLYDIIDYEDARWQPLAPGDGILAPWEKKSQRYGPGIILQVVETESSHSVFKNSKVLVNFWNGQTKKVSADNTVKIPHPLRERIVLELQMPLTAREMLVEQCPDYPYVVPPGYRASGPCRQNHLDWMHWHDAPNVKCAGTSCIPAHLPHCYFHFPSWKSASCPACTRQPGDTLTQRINLTKEELNRRIDEQLSKGRVPILEGYEMEESSKLKKENSFEFKSGEEMESKVTKPNKDHLSKNLREVSATTVDVATNTGKHMIQQRQKGFSQSSTKKSLGQPSQRNSSQKTHIRDASQLQAKLDWVNQSLKKNCSAIESVLCLKRSSSSPSIQAPHIPREAHLGIKSHLS